MGIYCGYKLNSKGLLAWVRNLIGNNLVVACGFGYELASVFNNLRSGFWSIQPVQGYQYELSRRKRWRRGSSRCCTPFCSGSYLHRYWIGGIDMSFDQEEIKRIEPEFGDFELPEEEGDY